MLMTSSLTYNETLPELHLFSRNVFLSMYMSCLVSRPASTIFSVYVLVHACLHLPMAALNLYYVLQRTKKCPIFSAAALSPSDCFTYNIVMMELIGVFGFLLTFCAIYRENSTVFLIAGIFLSTFTWFGEVFFHILTCLERYLAVVHPITYLSLKKERGIRMRNLVIGGVWLLSSLGIALMSLNAFTTTNFSLLFLSITIVSFCSLSVLCALIRSGPGRQARSRESTDQSKRRAFYIIVVILAFLLLRFMWGLFWAFLNEAKGSTDCFTMTADVWVNLPSSATLPLLFLLRAGKCVCCKANIQ